MSRHLIDVTGKKFGLLTVINRHSVNTRSKESQWNCVCSCGRSVPRVRLSSLLRKKKTSCLLCSRPHNPNALPRRKPIPLFGPAPEPIPPLTPVGLPEGSRRIDLTGKTFGRWTVLGASAHMRYNWVVKCSCGKVKEVPAAYLTSGKSKSCGCARAALLRILNSLPPAPERHLENHRNNPLYVIWLGIKTRCFNKNHPSYTRYGGSGVTMHPEWRRNFRSFAKHIGPRPSVYHSVDRIDANGNYEPGNVRWATRLEQAENRRANPFVVFQGSLIRLNSLAAEFGLPGNLIQHYALNGRNTLDRALKLSLKALKVLDGTATKADMDDMAASGGGPAVKGSMHMRTSFIDMTGRQMGPWRVLAYVGKQGRTYPSEWLCEDDEGNRRVINYVTLKDFPWLNQPENLPPDHVVALPEPQNNWV